MKLSLFGSGDFPATCVPGYRDLLGRAVTSLAVTDGLPDARVVLHRHLAYENVRAHGPELPGQLTGWLERRDRGTPVFAIALNGTIVATTQLFPGRPDWAAMLPPGGFVDGANHVEVFAVDPARHERVTRLSGGAAPRPLNVAFGAAERWGVRRSGLHGAEGRGDSVFYWTDGRARIDVPVDPANPPSELTVHVLFAGRAGKRMTVSIDGCTIVDERLPAGQWKKTVSLGRCRPSGYWASIEVASDTHKPPRDLRKLGVALHELTLR